MAAWGDLKNIFESPPRDSLSSWSQLLPEPSGASFEMFGELCLQVNPPSSSSLPPLPPRLAPCHPAHRRSPSSWYETMSEPDESSFEMFGEICYPTKPEPGDPKTSPTDGEEERRVYTRSYSDVRPRDSRGYSLPPPISSIGRCGKPRVYFKSYRKDGRFVLKEIRIPTQQLLHATREGGRLRMRVVQPDGGVGGGEGDEDDGGVVEEEEREEIASEL